MTNSNTRSEFKAKLLRPEKSGGGSPYAFVLLPKSASEKLPRRGRTTVEGSINGHSFKTTLEPDGKLSHWLQIDKELLEAAGAEIGDLAAFEIVSAKKESEPQTPSDLLEALAASPKALAAWEETTTIARIDWVHWIVSAKQAKTRMQRIENACDMLSSGKLRVCCFDPSGFYSKALSAPKAAD